MYWIMSFCDPEWPQITLNTFLLIFFVKMLSINSKSFKNGQKQKKIFSGQIDHLTGPEWSLYIFLVHIINMWSRVAVGGH